MRTIETAGGLSKNLVHYTSGAFMALDGAGEISHQLNHGYVGTQHLLLALYPFTTIFFERLGIDENTLRLAVVKQSPPNAVPSSPPITHTIGIVRSLERAENMKIRNSQHDNPSGQTPQIN